MFQRHPEQNQRLMFVTTNTKDRMPVFSDPTCAREAVEAIYRTQQRFPFFLYGFVVMSDHCHLLLCVPEHGSISKIMHAYKRAVAFSLNKGPIWQSRFHIVLPKDRGKTLEYIYANPVKAGLCKHWQDYPWSSACGKWDVSQFGIE